MRSPDYDRTMRHPTLVTGDGCARDALLDVIRSMSALTWMTRSLLFSDDEVLGPVIADGVHELFDQQCAMLNGIFEELGVEDEKRAEEREARGVVGQTKLPEDALLESAHKLRVEFIASNAKAGVDHGLIATALNLGKEDIERVVRRLRGEASAHTAAQGGRAVAVSRRASAQA